MNEVAGTVLIIIAAVLFAIMLAVAAAECVREMHARAVNHQRPAQIRPVLYDRHGTVKPLYVEDLRHGTGSAR